MIKLAQYKIYKLDTTRFINPKGKIVPVDLSYRQAIENDEIVSIQNNQLINAIKSILAERNIDAYISDIIVNVVVPTEKKKTGEKEYRKLALEGITFNGAHYTRFVSGAGQIRRNTITFIRDDIKDELQKRLLCGLNIEDFGNDFNSAKFNAYFGLNMSGCHLLPDTLTPTVCVVDDYEEVRPSDTVNHVTEREVQYITLEDKDYIVGKDDTEFIIDGNTAIRKSDGTEFTIHKGTKKDISSVAYDEIEESPALNSFDGQGLASPEWTEKVSAYLRCGYLPSGMIIRAPWVKGLLAVVPFKEYFVEHGVTEIMDIFGAKRNVQDIDVIISKSQFKMAKIYKKKCADMDINAWDYHVKNMKENGLHWAIARFNSRYDDDEKALNYQYLQALDLTKEETLELCQHTADYLTSLNSTDIAITYANLTANTDKSVDAYYEDDNYVQEDYKKLYQKIIEKNPDMINDSYVRSLILKECEAKVTGAKLGKILVRGNFQFCISDPVAQLEWIMRNHCGVDIDVKGALNAGEIYSNYWLNSADCTENIVLMRSPLIDRNEIAKRRIITDRIDTYKYLQSGIVYNIHDLTALQMGGCDFDGDIVFSTNNAIVAKGCYEYGIARPLYYALDNTSLVGEITPQNLIEADIRGLNSKVGTISNKAGSLYAMLVDYPVDSVEYKQIYDSIIALGQIVGMEIDRIKTGVAPTLPMEWTPLQAKTLQMDDSDFRSMQICSEEERHGIYRHNDFVPDIKPYYFRFNYKYIDKAIRQLVKCTNEVSVITFGFKFAELERRCKEDTATEAMQKLYAQYLSGYPVNDSECVVNIICHYFEDFEKSLAKQVRTETQNLIAKTVSKNELDADILAKVKDYLAEYKRFLKLVTVKYNTRTDSNSQRLKECAHENLKQIRTYYRDAICGMFDDIKTAYDYLCAATKDEKILMEIMQELILFVI